MFRSLLEATFGENAPILPPSDDELDPNTNEIEDGSSEEELELESRFWGLTETVDANKRSKNRRNRQEKRLLNNNNIDNINNNKIIIKKSIKGRVRRPKAVTPEVSAVLGEANKLFIRDHFDEAINMLTELLRKEPTIPDIYLLMSSLYNERNDLRQALQYNLLACALSNTNADLWKRAAKLSWKQDLLKQASYCFAKAAKINPADTEALNSCITLYSELDEYYKVARTYIKLAKNNPADLSLWLQAAEFYHIGQYNIEAEESLKKCIHLSFGFLPRSDAKIETGLHAVNMLADLYMSMKNYDVTIDIIESCYNFLLNRNDDVASNPFDLIFNESNKKTSLTDSRERSYVSIQDNVLPIDLLVKYGVAQLFLRNIVEAENSFSYLFQHNPADYADLFIDVADAYMMMNEANSYTHKIISILNRVLSTLQEINIPVLLKLARCYRDLKEYEKSMTQYIVVLDQQNKENEQAKVDPWTVLDAMSLTLEMNKPLIGIDIFKKYLPEVQSYPIRPFMPSLRSLNRRRVKDDRSVNKTFVTNNEDSCLEESYSTDDDIEETNNNETDEGTDNEMEYDSYEDFDDHDIDDDRFYSLNAMDNTVRLRLYVLWGLLENAAGNTNTFCKISVPIILASFHQTRERTRFKTRQQRRLASKRFINKQHTTGFTYLKQNFLVDSDKKSHNFQEDNSFHMVLTDIIQETTVFRALGQDLYVKLVFMTSKTLARFYNHIAAIEILAEVNSNKKVRERSILQKIIFQSIAIAIYHKEYKMAYECARLNVLEDIQNIGHWSVFYQVINLTGSFTWHQKFLARTLIEHPSNIFAITLIANHSAARDYQPIAIAEYTLALQQKPNDPLLTLCIAICYLNQSMQRTVPDRQNSVIKAFGFFHSYQKLRKLQIMDKIKKSNNNDLFHPDMAMIEGLYNLARAYHQLGLFHLALPLYEKILKYFDRKEQNEIPIHYSICRETAFNLSLIFRKNGAIEISRMLIRKYLTI